MKVQVLLFAKLSEIAGVREVELELSNSATGEELLKELGKRYPGLQPHLAAVRLAVEEEFYPKERPLPKEATVALIPPVSGG